MECLMLLLLELYLLLLAWVGPEALLEALEAPYFSPVKKKMSSSDFLRAVN
jgi:hypothetical protein